MLRLDKFIADSSDLTRSLATKAIKQKRVTINGELAKSASQKIPLESTVYLDDQPLTLELGFRYFLMNKPSGYLCANRDSQHPLIFDLLKDEINKNTLHTVGRLDLDTTGLLLITDDGQFSHHLTSPKRQQVKVYRAWLAEDLCAEAEDRFQQGVMLDNDEHPTLPAQLERINQREVLLSIYEGRYHQVKRMFAALGNAVIRLHREQLGNLRLDSKELSEGMFRRLTEDEIKRLLNR